MPPGVLPLRDHEEIAHRAVALERSRIARELHDVVAHSLSVITVQAAAARRTLDSDPDMAAKAISVIERSGRNALVELRQLLTLLRPEDSMRAGFEPSPGLENLPALVKQVNRAGTRAELHILGEAMSLPNEVELCAYRIVQEALTNVMKHAGTCGVDVWLRYADHNVELEIQDEGGNGSRTAHQANGAGSGVSGMSERAAHLGGRLEAGFHGSGYRVRAWLPVER